MKPALLALLSALPLAASAQAYKCTVGDSVVYQQQPCRGGTKLDIPAPPDPNSREGRAAAAIAAREVFIGMTEREVVQSWGLPDKINRTVTERTISEQWIYRRGSLADAQYLYLENHVLRSLQSPR